MQGDKKVIEQLNTALLSELTAIAQYMTQSEICQGWGYKRLGDLTKARAIEEMKHAEGLIERIIFLDSIPAATIGLKPRFGGNVQEQRRGQPVAPLAFSPLLAVPRFLMAPLSPAC